MLRKLCTAALFCTLAVLAAGAGAAGAEPLSGTAATAEQARASHTVQLGPCRIGAGEFLEYTTVDSRFEGQELPQGMYAGELTVELQGPIVVEAGGSLSIGTLSVGGSEASPLLRGTLDAQGLIVVEPGGSLILTDVTGDLAGEGLLVVQQPGSSVQIQKGDLDPALFRWAPPTVNNRYDTPDDLWLPEGTPLTLADLPTTQRVYLQAQGQETQTELALQWDLTPYDGRTAGSFTVTGQYLDKAGAPVPSLLPLTLTVQWYAVQEIPVVDSNWTGTQACTAMLMLGPLPEELDLWGEISTDGGQTWQVWEDFTLLQDTQGDDVAVFFLPDATQRLFRVVGTDFLGEEHWASRGVLLPTEDSSDQGGNHGGSLNPVVPERTPQPVEPTATPQPTETPRPTGTPAPSAPLQSVPPAASSRPAAPAQSAAAPAPTAAPSAQAGPTAAPALPGGAVRVPLSAAPQITGTPQPTATPAPTGSPVPSALPEAPQTGETADQPGTIPPAEQAPPASGWRQTAAVLAGLAVCAAAGLACALLRKK